MVAKGGIEPPPPPFSGLASFQERINIAYSSDFFDFVTSCRISTCKRLEGFNNPNNDQMTVPFLCPP